MQNVVGTQSVMDTQFALNAYKKLDERNTMIDGVVGLSDIGTKEMIDELEKRGYEVQLKGECSTCGRVVGYPHYCPGKGTGGGFTYSMDTEHSQTPEDLADELGC